MRLTRPHLIGLLALLVVGAGLWFYRFYFSSTDLAIRHAEAFLFRRMSVAQLADQGTYRFFYVTNRRKSTDEGPLKDQFGPERETALKFGLFDTRIQPSLGLGMLINPTEWFQNEEIDLMDIKALDEDDFVEELRRLVQASPYRSLLIVVHGFREAFPSALT